MEFFQFLSKFCKDIHSLKNNSGVSRYSYVVNKKNYLTYAIVIF